ncbi:MAG: hypothetical protein JF604_16855 [Bradyrhizobium sp.]|nr:hypothetical protein [Bradyrhizobium sp.]
MTDTAAPARAMVRVESRYFYFYMALSFAAVAREMPISPTLRCRTV